MTSIIRQMSFKIVQRDVDTSQKEHVKREFFLGLLVFDFLKRVRSLTGIKVAF